MKQIIDGKRYDTDTAQLIGHVGSKAHISSNDFSYWFAGLYVTRNGRYFIYGHGGASSVFAKSVGNGWSGSSGIIPISVDEAREYAERALEAEDVEKWFNVEDA